MRTCSRCQNWRISSICFDAECEVQTALCDILRRGHDRKESPEWMRGSDSCSKWEKKKLTQREEYEVFF